MNSRWPPVQNVFIQKKMSLAPSALQMLKHNLMWEFMELSCWNLNSCINHNEPQYKNLLCAKLASSLCCRTQSASLQQRKEQLLFGHIKLQWVWIRLRNCQAVKHICPKRLIRTRRFTYNFLPLSLLVVFYYILVLHRLRFSVCNAFHMFW